MPVVEDITVRREQPDGSSKWLKVGAVIEKNGKRYVKLDLEVIRAAPADWDGFAFMFKAKDREEKPAGQSVMPGYQSAPRKRNASKPQPPRDNEEIPFEDIPW